MVPVVLVILVPVLLYIPPVQDWAVGFATDKVNASTGMDVHVGRLRLRFPLSLSVDDVTVIEAAGDTMLTARNASVAVKILPLLRGHVDVDGLSLDSAFYQFGNADSLLWLRANIAKGDISATDILLKRKHHQSRPCRHLWSPSHPEDARGQH